MLLISKNKKLDQYSCRKQDTQANMQLTKKLESVIDDAFSKLLNTIVSDPK